MNDIERVIEEIERYKKCNSFSISTKSSKIAISALEKQMPKKPILQLNYDEDDCPVCNATINYKNYYCHNCGQKLDWEEEDE